ncbi:AsmA family protein [Vibrio salinus]|uniref:AsmA family protein n=1 Tax=Vibrio salinus TaxID=2899784 RepID=UPI001E5638A2|nr:AsmA family protein [Vibrio salinus]MCE0493848.1 AsmA family protein [Vibrio salinus]
MKKLSYLLLIILVSIVTLSSASFAIVLTHPNYLTPIINWLGQRYISPDLHITSARYVYPRELQLRQVEHNGEKNSDITIWFNNTLPGSLRHLSVDTILISDMDLSGKSSLYKTIQKLHPHQISLKNINIEGKQFNLKNANLQIKKPDWSGHTLLPYGQIQLQSKQVTAGSMTFNHVLLDVDYYQNESQIYGLSFRLNNAEIAIQAEKARDNNWHISSLTANHLNLTTQLFEKLKAENTKSRWHVSSIARIDLLNSSFSNQDLSISNLSLSAENITPDQWHIWSQNGLTISASAEGLSYAGKLWVEPILTAEIQAGTVHVKELSAKLGDGYLSVSADLTPDSMSIQNLRADNIKYYLESDHYLPESFDFPVSNLSIENLQLRNSQILQIATHPYWQLSGVNMDVNKATLRKQGEWRLWQGSVELSANNASYGDLKGTQAILQMHSQNHIWYLDRLFSPLRKGYIDLRGVWHFAPDQGNWNLNLNTDSFPVQTMLKYLDLPIAISGLADISLNVRGLTGNKKIISQTLTGNADVDLREGALTISDDKKPMNHPFTLDNLNLTSQRGLITIPPANLTSPSMTSTLSGLIDLDHWKKGKLQLSITPSNCKTINLNLLETKSIQAECHQ